MSPSPPEPRPEDIRDFPDPTPEQLIREPWRADPRWVAARDESVSPKRDDETASDRLARGLMAHTEMYRIAVEYGSR